MLIVISVSHQRLAFECCLLSANVLKIFRLVLEKELMLVHMVKKYAIDRVAHFVEIIHVELPNEGVIIGVLEILREHFLGESVQV